MTRDNIITHASQFVNNSPGNYISAEIAINPSLVEMRIFDSPLLAFGCPNDDIYAKYKSSEVIGEHFLPPLEWLPSAKTVISFFLPYSEEIKLANSQNYDWPVDAWLHARYEGQLFLKELAIYIQNLLTDSGYESLIPSFDARFKSGDSRDKSGSKANRFTSNWSERHIAYACGLGTFGLSKGLITEKGICGRFGSILTELDLAKDNRQYNGVYEYCTMCGACIPNCPVKAISFDDGKTDLPCSNFLDKTFDKHNPRYGCGKCQVGVPCMNTAPGLGR